MSRGVSRDERESLRDGRQVGQGLPAVLGGEERDAAHIRRRGPAAQGGAEAARLPARLGVQDRPAAEADLPVLRGQAGRRVRVQGVLPERLQEHARRLAEVQADGVRSDIPQRDEELLGSLPGLSKGSSVTGPRSM